MVNSLIHRFRRKIRHICLKPIHVYSLHHVSNSFEAETMNSCDWLQANFVKEAILAMMREKIEFISLREAYRHISHDLFRIHKYAVLTFDDGYSSIKEILPWLENHAIPVTLFINGKYLDGQSYRDNPKEKYLTYEDLFQLSSELIEIGSHGWEHVDLTSQTEDDFAQSIEKNILLLSQHQRYIPFHAYTWGHRNDSLDRFLHKLQIVPVLMDGMKNYNDVFFIHRESFPQSVLVREE